MKKRTNIILIVLFIILFLGEVYLVKSNKIMALDMKIYTCISYLLNEWTIKTFKIITFLGSAIFMVALCLIFLTFDRKKGRGVSFSLILFISTLLNQSVKLIIKRPRPEYMNLVIENTYSFPSGHTMAICTTVGLLLFNLYKSNLKKWQKIIISCVLCIIAALVMFSRILLGAHYFSDVIGGLTLSILLLLIIYYYISFYIKSPYFKAN